MGDERETRVKKPLKCQITLSLYQPIEGDKGKGLGLGVEEGLKAQFRLSLLGM
jgi:hypothetical protein